MAVVEGELDLLSAPLLKETLTSLLRAGSGRLVLDFSGVPFIDSTALSVLIGVRRRLGRHERLAIAAAGDQVLRVFELSGVRRSFQMFPTVDDALEYVTSGDAEKRRAPTPPLTADAALMVGIASTAMRFAQSEEDEAERWLRVLRRHGEAGAVLGSLGVSEAPVHARERDPGPSRARATDPVTAVTERASQIAAQRHASRVATTHVLAAVMGVYGTAFDRVLAAHGGDHDELALRVGTYPAAA